MPRLSFLLCMCSAVAHAGNTPTNSLVTHDHTADGDHPLSTQMLTKPQFEEEDDDDLGAARIEFEKGLNLPDCDVRSLSLPE